MPETDPKNLQLVACPHPFRDAQVVHQIAAGGTVAEILAGNGMGDVLAGDWLGAVVEIDGVEVLPEWWGRVRPRAGHLMTVKVIPAGGEGGKEVVRMVAMLALVAGAIALGQWEFLGAAAPYIGAAAGIGGALALNALIPPPAEDISNNTFTGVSRANAITGTRNTANPYGPVPQVFGKRLIYPQYAAEPYAEYVGDEQYLRLLFLIGYGFYDLTSHQIGDTDSSEYTLSLIHI